MAVSRERVIQWCTRLIDESPGFPPLGECLDAIPRLESLADLPAGTRVLVRGDTDVVVDAAGNVQEAVRLQSLLETLRFGWQRGWVQVLYGHRGREPELSLEPVARCLRQLLAEAGVAAEVVFIDEWMDDRTGRVLDLAAGKLASLPAGAMAVLENTRRYALETVLWKARPADLPDLAERLANYANGMRYKLAAVHVNEGFASSNRDLSSTLVPVGMDRVALGTYVRRELGECEAHTRQAELVIFSGMKIDKLDALEQILERGRVRMVIAAGSLAISLKKAEADLAGRDFEMGLNGDPAQKKLYIPPERIEQARRLLARGREAGVEFVLPVDFILKDGTASPAIPKDQAQFDVGPQTIALQAAAVGRFIEFHRQKQARGEGAAVAFHNGVFGKFEEEQYAHGTRKFMEQLKRLHDAGVKVYVGGGEGGLALARYGDESWVTHCYTAGGTVLKALGTEPIPFIKALYLKVRGEGG